MADRSPRKFLLISYSAFILLYTAVVARAVFTLRDEADFWVMVGLLAAYLVLMVSEYWLVPRSLVFLHVFNAVQTVIVLALLLTVGYFDFFANLLIPPCAQSILYFRRRTAFTWIGVMTLSGIWALLEHFPLREAVGYIIVYPAAILLVSGMCYLALQAEKAQIRSESLLADLQVANRKLQAYAAQVQELAAAEERNRLARELHDSVTQIIFGLTLSAQAARILIDRSPARAAAELDHLQVLAQTALAEMRALIQQLHPRSIAEEGLAAALRRLAAERQANDGLTVDLQITGEKRLPVKIEEELFRVAQEALNNIAKHAQTDRAVITLDLENDRQASLCIEDAGVGFDPEKARSLPGHLGLTSMAERIQALGGALALDSSPGKGTCVRVELNLEQEVEHAG